MKARFVALGGLVLIVLVFLMLANKKPQPNSVAKNEEKQTVSTPEATTNSMVLAGADYYPDFVAFNYPREFSVSVSTPPTGLSTGTITELLGEETEIRGKKYSKLTTSISGLGGASSETVKYMRRASDGIYLIDGAAMDRPEYQTVPFPISAGQEWSFQSLEGNWRWTAESRDDLNIRDQTIRNCVKLRGILTQNDGAKAEMETFIAPGLGEVKSTMKTRGGTVEVSLNASAK